MHIRKYIQVHLHVIILVHIYMLKYTHMHRLIYEQAYTFTCIVHGVKLKYSLSYRHSHNSYTYIFILLYTRAHGFMRIYMHMPTHAHYKWCTTWQLQLNFVQCYIVWFGLVNKPSLFYYFNGTVAATIENVTDLGVIFDNRMSFTNHCHFIARKAYDR